MVVVNVVVVLAETIGNEVVDDTDVVGLAEMVVAEMVDALVELAEIVVALMVVIVVVELVEVVIAGMIKDSVLEAVVAG